MDHKQCDILVHELINLWRGFTKIMEEDWQQSSGKLGVTMSELHVLRIVYLEKEVPMSYIAKMGLWDLSTVMQLTKRLTKKELVITTKKENDMRVSYVSLTEKGKVIFEQSRQYRSPLFSLIQQLYHSSEENKVLLQHVVAFQKWLNSHYHGPEYVNWIERTGSQLHEKFQK